MVNLFRSVWSNFFFGGNSFVIIHNAECMHFFFLGCQSSGKCQWISCSSNYTNSNLNKSNLMLNSHPNDYPSWKWNYYAIIPWYQFYDIFFEFLRDLGLNLGFQMVGKKSLTHILPTFLGTKQQNGDHYFISFHFIYFISFHFIYKYKFQIYYN